VLLPSLVFSQSRLSIIVAAMLMTIVFGRLTLQNGDDCTISRLVKKTREAVINFPCDKVGIGHAGAHFVGSLDVVHTVLPFPGRGQVWTHYSAGSGDL